MDDYDTPWKDALSAYFPEFMSFYFPKAYAQIDWSVPHVFLEQELAQVARDAQLGSRRVDKLVCVTQRDGMRRWVYIHVDVQAQCEPGFAERMYVYNYRIYDRYHAPVASMALLADCNAGWKPSRFVYELFGCRVGIHFPVIKLSDYRPRLEQLIHDDNVFGLVTAAHLLAQQTRGRDVERYAAKWRLARLLYERHWDKQRILDLFNVIDWIMHLPTSLQSQLMVDIDNLERNRNMPYINSFEQRGLDRGRQEGRQEGQHEALRTVVSMQLTQRFGALPPAAHERVQTATVAELQAWSVALLDAPTLESVFASS
jgi:hypothetical protein